MIDRDDEEGERVPSDITADGRVDERSPARKALEAKAALKTHMRHGLVGMSFAERTTGFDLEWADVVGVYGDECAATKRGDLGAASNMLTAQAMTLDAVFTDMLSRSSRNLGEYPEAAERYMRMALKAQAQSRATIEALARMHQPREQIVRHVTVHEGGQAIVADQFHHHQQQHQPGQGANEKRAEQSHAQSPSVAPLPSPDPLGHAVPIPGSARQDTMQDARRDEPGSAEGQSERLEARR